MAAGGTVDPQLANLARSRFDEDVRPQGHASVWGSWYCAETRRWGFACCRATTRTAPPCCSIATASESDVESLRSARRQVSVSEQVRDWRPREAFETAEGFIGNAVQYLATQWPDKLRDGTLAASSAAKNPDVAKAILSEANAVEAARGVQQFCKVLNKREVPADITRPLEEFCSSIGIREYVQANKAYMEIVMGSRKWQGDVPYLVEGNRNGPSVVQNVAERLNKQMSNPLDAAGIRDHTVTLRRLLTVAQAAHPNEDPSKNCG